MNPRRALFSRLVLLGVLALGSLLWGHAAAPTVRFSSYLGGSRYEIPMAVAAGTDGAVYVAGLTESSDFGTALPPGSAGSAFLAKVAPDGASLVYAIRLGGFFPRALAVDGEGQVYAAGYSYYNGLPVTNAFQANPGNGFDAVVVKLNAAGNRILFATFLGGNGDDGALALALDRSGGVWVSGLTASDDFPTRGQPFQSSRAGELDAFLARVSNDGRTLEYATYLGGPDGVSQAAGLAVDGQGRIILCGRTSSSVFPTRNALQPAIAGGSDAFLSMFDPSGRSLVFSTYIGGSRSDSGAAVAVDAAGNLYLQGSTQSDDFPIRAAFQGTRRGEEDIVVAKVRSDGSALVYSTYLGSSLSDAYRGWPNQFGAADVSLDSGGIAVSPSGRALVIGSTYGADYPVRDPVKATNDPYFLDVVATLLEPDGTVAYSTLLGGSSAELGVDVAYTPDGGFITTGYTTRAQAQPDFPTTPGALQTINPSQDIEAFLLKLDDGAPPLRNDSFASAHPISGAEVSLLVQTGAATREPGEPLHNGNTGGKSIWFRWTVPTTGRAILSTDVSTFPTLLAVYRGERVDALVPVVIPGVVDTSTFSEARFPVVAGETLWVAVDGRDGASGTAVLSLNLSLPPNDDFDQRIALVGERVAVSGSNAGATSERNDRGPRSIWWKWTAPTTGYYTATTDGSQADNALGVYSGDSLAKLVPVAFNNAYTNAMARVTFHAEAGSELQFMVMSENGETGPIRFAIAPAVRPSNDDFPNRTRLSGRNVLVSGTNFDSVGDAAEGALQRQLGLVGGSGRWIWWEWTSPIDGAAEISTTNSVRFWNPDEAAATTLVVFAGDSLPGSPVSVLTAEAGESRLPASVFLTDVRAGTRYQIGVDCVEWQQPIHVSLRVRAIAPPRILANTTRIETNGQLRARVEGIEGHNYRVQSSPDLKRWEPVSEHPAILGEFEFSAPVSGTSRFYRIEEY